MEDAGGLTADGPEDPNSKESDAETGGAETGGTTGDDGAEAVTGESITRAGVGRTVEESAPGLIPSGGRKSAPECAPLLVSPEGKVSRRRQRHMKPHQIVTSI